MGVNLGQVSAIALTDVEPTNHNILWKKSTEDVPFYYDTTSSNWLPLNTTTGATITFPGTDPATQPTPPAGSATWGWYNGSFWWKDDAGIVKTLDFGDYFFDGKMMKASYSPGGGAVMDVLKVAHLINPVIGGGLYIGDKTGPYFIDSMGTVMTNSRLTIAGIDASGPKSKVTKEWTQKEIGLVPNTLSELTDTAIGVPIADKEGLLYDSPSSKWVSRPITVADILNLQSDLDGKEDYLGKPTVDGYILSSQIDGTRGWVAQSSVGTTTFTGLTDTPTNYTGSGAKVLSVKADESGVEFIDSTMTTFLGLTDTPSTYVAGQNVRVNAAGTAVEFQPNTLEELTDVVPGVPIADGEVLTYDLGNSRWEAKPPTGGGGSSTFVDLTDTPTSYTGETGKVPTVNAAEDGLEFISPTTKEASRFEFYAVASQANFPLGESLAANALVSVNGVTISSTNYDGSVANNIHFLKPLQLDDFVVVLNNADTSGGAADKVDRAGDTMTGNLAINTAGANNFSLTSPVGKSIALGASGSPPEFTIVGGPTTAYQFTSYSGGAIQSALTFKANGNLGLVNAAGTPVVPTAPEDLVTRAYADTKPDISAADELTGHMNIATVAALPAAPDANTIYFVTA